MSRATVLAVALVLLASACSASNTGSLTSEPADQISEPAGTSAPASTTSASDAAQVADTPELGETSWKVTTYRLPNGNLTNVWKTEVTISFAADGTVSGSAGCNEYEATWVVSGAYDAFESGVRDSDDGQVLLFDSLVWTEETCEDDAIMEQEAEILDLLQQGGRWVLIRDNFNLRDGEGAFLFEAQPE